MDHGNFKIVHTKTALQQAQPSGTVRVWRGGRGRSRVVAAVTPPTPPPKKNKKKKKKKKMREREIDTKGKQTF